MHPRPSLSLFAPLLASFAVASFAAAQEPRNCRQPNDEALNLLGYVRGMAGATDSVSIVRRGRWHIPAVSPDSIDFVARERLCERAAEAYEQYVPMNQHREDRRVWVIRAGDVFIVSDPSIRVGEWGLIVVFDRRLRRLAAFL